MEEEKLLKAITRNLERYCAKYRFEKAVLGISGGIDSALTAAIAVRAIGKENVIGVFMPSMYTSRMSKKNARAISKNLGIKLLEIQIKTIYAEYIYHLRPQFKGTKMDATEQNLQARIRANILMALSNKHHYLVLATSNKSESMVGYGTLYGDAAGGIAPLGNLYKGEVYMLANFINREAKKGVIPKSVISRPPTAELKPGQKDEDDLPSYNVLDEILRLLVDKKKTVGYIVSKGYRREIVERVARMVGESEFKRSQSPRPLQLR